jgi:Ca2+:H+ antiporter
VLKATVEDDDVRESTILNLSRGTAVLLLFLYVLYLWFQLRTHHNLFGAEAAAQEQGNATGSGAAPSTAEEEEEEEHMNPWEAAGVLVITTILVSVCADYLVESIDSLVDRAGLSRNFIGLILIPIVGNAAEHVTAVVVAIKNKMDLVCERTIQMNALVRVLTYFSCDRLWELLSAPASRSLCLLHLSWSSWVGL